MEQLLQPETMEELRGETEVPVLGGPARPGAESETRADAGPAGSEQVLTAVPARSCQFARWPTAGPALPL